MVPPRFKVFCHKETIRKYYPWLRHKGGSAYRIPCYQEVLEYLYPEVLSPMSIGLVHANGPIAGHSLLPYLKTLYFPISAPKNRSLCTLSLRTKRTQ